LVSAGLLITFSAFVPRHLVGASDFQDWVPWIWLDKDDLPVVQSVLTNVGTAFITAGLLALFEPLLARKVRAEAKAAASLETSSLRQEVGERLTSLEKRVAAAVAEEVKQQDEAISAAEQELTYDSVVRLFKKAWENKALDGDQITVQGTDKPGELTLSLVFEHVYNVFDHDPIGTSHVLVLRGESPRAEAAEPVDVTWSSGENFEDVAARLLLELAKTGAGLLEEVPWQQTTERFAAALSLAIRSRRRDRGVVPLRGRLREIVADRWFITDKGLECPTYDLWVDAQTWPPIRQDGGFGGKRPQPAEKPAAADQAEWDYVLARCDNLFAARLDAAGNRLFR
jgi:hypothetical protein